MSYHCAPAGDIRRTDGNIYVKFHEYGLMVPHAATIAAMVDGGCDIAKESVESCDPQLCLASPTVGIYQLMRAGC